MRLGQKLLLFELPPSPELGDACTGTSVSAGEVGTLSLEGDVDLMSDITAAALRARAEALARRARPTDARGAGGSDIDDASGSDSDDSPSDVVELRSATDHVGLEIEGGDFSTIDLEEAVFEDCHLRGTRLGGARLHNSSLRATHLHDVDAANTVFSDALLLDVEIVDCRLLGADFTATRLRRVVFQGCNLSMATFRFARLDSVVFRDCDLVETDFQACKAARVSFTRCRIDRTEFSQAEFSGGSVQDCEIRSLSGTKNLAGLTIDAAALADLAPLFAAHLGIDIEYGPEHSA